MNISKEAFDEWRTHPVTKEVFAAITLVKQELLKEISSGITLGHSADITHGATNRAVGHIEGLDQLLSIDFTSEEDNKLM